MTKLSVQMFTARNFGNAPAIIINTKKTYFGSKVRVNNMD